MKAASEEKMLEALLVVMDTLEHSDLTDAGKSAVLEAAGGLGNETIFENAEPFLRLKRALQPLAFYASAASGAASCWTMDRR